MQILLECELSICNKLVVCLEQENLNDADISNTHEKVQLVRSVAERLSIRSARNRAVRFGCRLLFEVDFTIKVSSLPLRGGSSWMWLKRTPKFSKCTDKLVFLGHVVTLRGMWDDWTGVITRFEH